MSCLGWEEYDLFYQHDENGVPTDYYKTDSISEPKFLTDGLKETNIILTKTPELWFYQDWSGTQNLNRIGGPPVWALCLPSIFP